MRARFLAVIAVLIVSACSQFSLVDKGKPTTVADTYTVEPQIVWNTMSTNNLTVWTIDGPVLDSLVFFDPVKDDTPLFVKPDKENMPVFRSGMTALEIKDLFEASLSRLDTHNVKVTNLRPARFGDLDGFRFDYTSVTKDGLERAGFAVGTVQHGILYMAYYTGAKIYYFEKYKPDAERIIQSIRFNNSIATAAS